LPTTCGPACRRELGVSLAMMLGRLELFTVLVLLRPEFWRS
jgi:Trk-type K+ transport system membrane component